MEKTRLRARWGPRKETAEECARRMQLFLNGLAKCDEIFTHGWFKCAKTATEAKANQLEKIELSLEFLKRLLERERVRGDRDKAIIEDLGFMPGRFWNGTEGESAFIFVECGAYPNPQTMPGANAVWIDFPTECDAVNRLLQPHKLRQIMRVVVESWDPDWARVSTDKIEAEIYPENPYLGQKVGWLTYVSDRYGDLPALPPECDATRIDTFGNLILIRSLQNITVSNANHVAIIRRLSNAMKIAGMLAPTPPT